jgi:hypothetical protein
LKNVDVRILFGLKPAVYYLEDKGKLIVLVNLLPGFTCRFHSGFFLSRRGKNIDLLGK